MLHTTITVSELTLFSRPYMQVNQGGDLKQLSNDVDEVTKPYTGSCWL